MCFHPAFYLISDFVAANACFGQARITADAIFHACQQVDGDSLLSCPLFDRVRRQKMTDAVEWKMARICFAELSTEHRLSQIRVAKKLMVPTQFDFSNYRHFFPTAEVVQLFPTKTSR